MTSNRTWNRITMVVLFVLVLAIGIGLISTSPAAAAENQKDSRITELEQQIAQLQQEQTSLILVNTQLTELVTQLRTELETQYILVLRHEDAVLPGFFGDSFTVNCRIQEISVGKELFDSCQIGDDITNTQLHIFLASGALSQTRVIVENKITR